MDLYHDMILDHYHNPRTHGTLDAPTHHRCAVNPSCGDNLCIDLLVDEHHIIRRIMFRGNGCAISQAATSLLTEHVTGKDTDTICAMTRDDMIALLGVPVGAGRMRCALLGLDTLHKMLLSPDEKR